MLGCIACSRRLNAGSLEDEDCNGNPRSPASREAIKNLTSQIKDMALKFSGSQRYCKSGTGSNLGREQRCLDSELCSEVGTPGGVCSTQSWNASKSHFIRDSSRIGTPKFDKNDLGAFDVMEEEEEEESKEWISQVEPGVLITLVSLKAGRNDLKRIRFSRELFDKCQAQRWWAENHEKVMELYNVRPPAKSEFATAPEIPRSEDESERKMQESGGDSPVTPPPQNMSLLPRGLYLSRTSSSREADRSDDLQSCDNSMKSSSQSSGEQRDQEQEHEWVEEDEPGVYITIRSSPSGSREVKRVRFSREKFSEMQARLWWEENRHRIQEQYINCHTL